MLGSGSGSECEVLKQKSGETALALFLRPLFCASDGNRTRTRLTANRILSPARLPVPPPRPLLTAVSIRQNKKKFQTRRFGIFRAEDETRTRDPNLGKVVLYQLSYFRICFFKTVVPVWDCKGSKGFEIKNIFFENFLFPCVVYLQRVSACIVNPLFDELYSQIHPMFLTANKVHNGHSFMPQGTTLEVDAAGTVVSILDAPTADTLFYDGILVPGFVNAHCHLELSHMKGAISKGTGLIPFLQQVTFNRNNWTAEQKEHALQHAFVAMKQNGVVAVGDISNTTDTLPQRGAEDMRFHTFVECIGFNPAFAEKAFHNSFANYQVFAQQLPESGLLQQSLVPHAPYSVSPALFQLIDKALPGSVISIHNQESAAENSFYIDKTGAVLDLLNGFNIDHSSFVASGKTSLTTYMEYFTTQHSYIFVHNTFSAREDIEYLQSRNIDFTFCLCPNANLYIENRLPPVEMFQAMNVRLCLGTDSLASNDSLSIIEEMNTLLAMGDGVALEHVITWATYNGACALKMDQQMGSFEVGKTPGINLLDYEGGKLGLKEILA